MGSSFYPLKSGIKNPVRAPRYNNAPKRSLQELADEFGVTVRHLNACIASDHNAPRACLSIYGGNMTPSRSYYEPKAVREWWQNRAAALSTRA